MDGVSEANPASVPPFTQCHQRKLGSFGFASSEVRRAELFSPRQFVNASLLGCLPTKGKSGLTGRFSLPGLPQRLLTNQILLSSSELKCRGRVEPGLRKLRSGCKCRGLLQTVPATTSPALRPKVGGTQCQ